MSAQRTARRPALLDDPRLWAGVILGGAGVLLVEALVVAGFLTFDPQSPARGPASVPLERQDGAITTTNVGG